MTRETIIFKRVRDILEEMSTHGTRLTQFEIAHRAQTSDVTVRKAVFFYQQSGQLEVVPGRPNQYIVRRS